MAAISRISAGFYHYKKLSRTWEIAVSWTLTLNLLRFIVELQHGTLKPHTSTFHQQSDTAVHEDLKTKKSLILWLKSAKYLIFLKFPTLERCICARQIKGDFLCRENQFFSIIINAVASRPQLIQIHVNRIDSIFFACFLISSQNSEDSAWISRWRLEARRKQRIEASRKEEWNTFLRAKFMGFYSVIIVRRRHDHQAK